MTRPRLRARLAAGLSAALLGGLLSACGGSTSGTAAPTPVTPGTDPAPTASTPPTTAPPTSAPPTSAPPTPEPPTASPGSAVTVEDGTYPAYLTAVDPDRLTFDRIEILSGQEAAAARAEDGEPPAEEGVDLPYLRNRNPLLRTAPVGEDVAVQVYDCSRSCTLTAWDYGDLVAGEPLPYGAPTTPFTLTVRDGRVVELVEVYLP